MTSIPTIRLISLSIFTLILLLPVTEQCYPRSDDKLEKADTKTQENENPFRKHLKERLKKKKFDPPGPGEVVYGFQPVNILSSFLDEASVKPAGYVKSFLDVVPGTNKRYLLIFSN